MVVVGSAKAGAARARSAAPSFTATAAVNINGATATAANGGTAGEDDTATDEFRAKPVPSVATAWPHEIKPDKGDD
jgi:hypothetical protein